MVLKAVLCDLDGVIADTAIYHYRAWQQIAKELGVSIDIAFNEQLKGISRKESLQRILKAKHIELNDKDFHYYMEKKNDIFKDYLQSLSVADSLPSIPAFFREVKEQHIKIIIASSSANAPFVLDRLALLSFVDGIVDPKKLKAQKPAPDIFLTAAKMANVHKKECIGIEDAQAGIDALNGAGIKSVGIGKHLKNAHMLLSSSRELNLQKIKKIL